MHSAGNVKEIEERAQEARREVASRLANLGLGIPPESDVSLAAELLTGGTVDPAPNLTDRLGGRLAGTLEWNLGVVLIRFEAYDPKVRQRFSIAHEIGHFWLHAGSVPAPRWCATLDVNADEQEGSLTSDGHAVGFDGALELSEREADLFAAAFLIPADQLARDLAEYAASTPFLAERYQVSAATMRRRLRTLGASL